MKQTMNGEGAGAVVVVMPGSDVSAHILCRAEEAEFLRDRCDTHPVNQRM